MRDQSLDVADAVTRSRQSRYCRHFGKTIQIRTFFRAQCADVCSFAKTLRIRAHKSLNRSGSSLKKTKATAAPRYSATPTSVPTPQYGAARLRSSILISGVMAEFGDSEVAIHLSLGYWSVR